MRGALEAVAGFAWVALAHAWGIVLGLALVLFPLGAAIALDVVLREPAPALALAGGVAAAYLLGISPWDGVGRWSLPVGLASAAGSWALWNAIVRPADAMALLAAVGVAAVGWSIRRR